MPIFVYTDVLQVDLKPGITRGARAVPPNPSAKTGSDTSGSGETGRLHTDGSLNSS